MIFVNSCLFATVEVEGTCTPCLLTSEVCVCRARTPLQSARRSTGSFAPPSSNGSTRRVAASNVQKIADGRARSASPAARNAYRVPSPRPRPQNFVPRHKSVADVRVSNFILSIHHSPLSYHLRPTCHTPFACTIFVLHTAFVPYAIFIYHFLYRFRTIHHVQFHVPFSFASKARMFVVIHFQVLSEFVVLVASDKLQGAMGCTLRRSFDSAEVNLNGLHLE